MARDLRNESKTDWKSARKAKDYRSFLRAYLEDSGSSLSDLAREAGFGRGFPGDVISGKRRLSGKSFAAFETAMKLPANGRKLFRYLVAREERDLFPALEKADLDSLIEELRRKDWIRVRHHRSQKAKEEASLLFADPNVFAVFAASGTAEIGADFDRIRERTGLGALETKRAIEGLVRAGLLRVSSHPSGERYHLNDAHVFLKTRGKDLAFIRLFQTVAARAAKRIPEAIDSDSEMFFTSSFCVKETRLPALKAALRKTMLQFVDESIDTEGDRVVQLMTALFR